MEIAEKWNSYHDHTEQTSETHCGNGTYMEEKTIALHSICGYLLDMVLSEIVNFV